jgi:hypothetical protein
MIAIRPGRMHSLVLAYLILPSLKPWKEAKLILIYSYKMPPKSKTVKPKTIDLSQAIPISKGAGMTAGLEIHRLNNTFVLVDSTPDNRFAADVAEWNTTAAASLNVPNPKKNKDAKK